jgi:hypothetical protein
MTTDPRPRWRRWLLPRLFTPWGLAQSAIIIAVLYLIAYALGWRQATTILCGTSPTGSLTDKLSIHEGIAYVLLWLAFVIVAPVLLIAAGVLAGLNTILRRRKNSRGSTIVG